MNSTPCLLLNPGRVHAGAGSLSVLTELARHFRAQRVLAIGPQELEGLVDGAAKVTRLLDNNPRAMTREDMRQLYAALI